MRTSPACAIATFAAFASWLSDRRPANANRCDLFEEGVGSPRVRQQAVIPACLTFPVPGVRAHRTRQNGGARIHRMVYRAVLSWRVRLQPKTLKNCGRLVMPM